MRKFIITGMAVAMLAAVSLPSVASADVPRHQEQTATFTVEQPKDATAQFSNVWRHEFKVTVNPCDGTFTGTAPTYDNHASTPTWTENVTGSFGNGTVSFTTDPIGGGATFKVTDAPMDNSTIHNVETTWTANEIEFQISPKSITDTTDYKNHGQYVKAQADKNDAAHSCIGMPINSSK